MYQIYPKSGKQFAAAICSIVNIFFSLKVAHMRIDNNFKGHYIENPPKLNYANISVLKSPNFDAANIKWFTVIHGESR